MADEILEGSEVGLAFVIVGILLFVIEVFQPGFLIAVPGTVFIVLGILLSFGVTTRGLPSTRSKLLSIEKAKS